MSHSPTQTLSEQTGLSPRQLIYIVCELHTWEDLQSMIRTVEKNRQNARYTKWATRLHGKKLGDCTPQELEEIYQKDAVKHDLPSILTAHRTRIGLFDPKVMRMPDPLPNQPLK